jgi:hypothetical protein
VHCDALLRIKQVALPFLVQVAMANLLQPRPPPARRRAPRPGLHAPVVDLREHQSPLVSQGGRTSCTYHRPVSKQPDRIGSQPASTAFSVLSGLLNQNGKV